MPIVPFDFDPDSNNYEEHLVYEDIADGQNVSWATVGLKIVVPQHKWSPEQNAIEKANGGLVRFYSSIGFSAGQYHEFFVEDVPHFAGFKMGKLEVTFGEASPMIAYLFSGEFDANYFGDWSYIRSARIYGASYDEAELAFANAAIRYEEGLGQLPRILSLDTSMFGEEEDVHQPHVKVQDPATSDVDPVRFLYHGLSLKDDSAACVYFYKVLEYYSFQTNKKKIIGARHDSSLSDDEFSKQILQLLTKDEKGPILWLINNIADEVIVKRAYEAKLIEKANSAVLGDSVYAFRNSIVHGKHGYGTPLHSSAIITENTLVKSWRLTLRELAKRAMFSFGAKLL